MQKVHSESILTVLSPGIHTPETPEIIESRSPQQVTFSKETTIYNQSPATGPQSRTYKTYMNSHSDGFNKNSSDASNINSIAQLNKKYYHANHNPSSIYYIPKESINSKKYIYKSQSENKL